MPDQITVEELARSLFDEDVENEYQYWDADEDEPPVWESSTVRKNYLQQAQALFAQVEKRRS